MLGALAQGITTMTDAKHLLRNVQTNETPKIQHIGLEPVRVTVSIPNFADGGCVIGVEISPEAMKYSSAAH